MSWDLSEFDDKDVVFVGAGKGRAMAGIQDFLNKHAHINSFTGLDKQLNADDPLNFLHDYDQTKTIFVKNEGIPGDELSVPYITPLQLFFRLVQQTGASTVGITGTKGKSTTTALTAHILENGGKHVVLAGNIGMSPLLELDTATAETIFVLELSSYQLSDLTVSPHISACLNLYNDHTDWHGSLAGYWEAKHNIMRFAGSEDIFIYNPDFPELQRWTTDAACKTIAIDPQAELDLSHANLFGDHNRLNALIAREIARQFDITDDIFQAALNSFQPLQHRMQIVATKDGRTYVDDGIGMTPESTTASMKAVQQKYGSIGCLLLGGQDRNYDYGEFMQFVAGQRVPLLVLFPDTIDKMKAAMPADYQPEMFETRDMTEAVRYAAEHAPHDSVVLLSTAAPSYSLWKDFEDKGDQFQAAVHAL